MEYVVFETGGKQYRAEKGQILDVENLTPEKPGSISFDRVLLHVNDSEVNIGKPHIANLTVKAKILENLKGKKVRTARFTAKSRHRRVVGHRQLISRIQVEGIVSAK